MLQPLKFRMDLVIFPHTLLLMWLLTHTGSNNGSFMSYMFFRVECFVENTIKHNNL